MKLADFSQGRDNNFNLIRMTAAFAVMVTHCFVLATGNAGAEPFVSSLGITLGKASVDVFFITSGFLVTASLLNKRSLTEFVWARALRILPALWGMTFLTVFGLGLFFTTLPKLDYLASKATYIHLLKNLILVKGIGAGLPGVFEDNPYKRTVNGSLWTMIWEVRMYLLLALIWLVLRIVRRKRETRPFKCTIVALASAAAIDELYAQLHPSIPRCPLSLLLGQPLFFMFFAGGAFYVLKEYIVLSRWLFWIFAGSLSASAFSKGAFLGIYDLTLAYILFFIAYVPSGFIRTYNRLGDYSYGFYIYAFPVQQSVAALIPGVSVCQMLVLSVVFTSLLAVLSWHLLEQRALSYKSRCVDYTKNLPLFIRARRLG